MPITYGSAGGSSIAQQRLIELLSALLWRHEVDRAVPMLLVVPMHELVHRATRTQLAWRRFERQPGSMLDSAGQGLVERVVVA